MRDSTIARNYAEALLALARKAEDPRGWGRMLQEIADAVAQDEKLRLFLEAPRIAASEKNAVIAKAFQDRYPRLFVRFLQTLVGKGRQMLLGQVATEYFALLDEAEGRVHAQVTLASEPSEADKAGIAAQLSRALGKTVVPHVSINPAILGGVVVRVGDTVMDGSVRSRLVRLRKRLVTAKL